MSQKSLIGEPASEFVGVENVIPTPVEQLPAVIDTIQAPQSSALADLRSTAMLVPVETMQVALAEYANRRAAFRDWIRQQLISGIHFGYPPGCEPKRDERGWIGVWKKGADGEKGRYDWYPPEQWQAKPSLYAAGADFLTDLLGVRCEYEADTAGWQQLGGKGGQFVYLCRLVSRATGEVIGEGRGVRRVGQKGGDENNAIKMAQKSAKVCAVLDSWGLRDLFTQQEPDDGEPPVNNPTQAPSAPKAQPRSKRPTPAELTGLIDTFKACKPPDERNVESFTTWAGNILSRKFTKVTSPEEWTTDAILKCRRALEEGL